MEIDRAETEFYEIIDRLTFSHSTWPAETSPLVTVDRIPAGLIVFDVLTSTGAHDVCLIENPVVEENSELSVQSSVCLNPRSLVGYFEISVQSLHESGAVMVGLAPHMFPNSAMPGKGRGSYGYLSTDGRKFSYTTTRSLYGEFFEVNDVVGCGINFLTHEIFFTKNGRMQGVAFDGAHGTLYPTIGLLRASVRMNVGARPFSFDLNSFLSSERTKYYRKALKKAPSTNLQSQVVVGSYLAHEGHVGSLIKFAAQTGLDRNVPFVRHAEHRLRLRTLIVEENDMLQAIELVKSVFPQLMDQFPQVSVYLYCLQLVRLLGEHRTEDALRFCEEKMVALVEDPRINRCELPIQDYLNNAMGLIAYVEPEKSPVSFLFSIEERTRVWMELNRYILHILGVPPINVLSILVRQLGVAHLQIFEDAAEPRHEKTR